MEPALPRMLTEGEYVTLRTQALWQLDQNPKAIEVLDSAGKRWRLPRKELRQLFAELADLKSEGKIREAQLTPPGEPMN